MQFILIRNPGVLYKLSLLYRYHFYILDILDIWFYICAIILISVIELGSK